ncbi:reticulon-4-interacting protein 1 homolog, mitochondrial-like isoform X1 [Ptychodera flava]|uniref:reticulon-4-interacting protein 1 homolog, mitochondrial-like isoform X1 n=1 Tax=Ptychodera flava TaxID=63121 RepID=UPI00396A3A49
MVFIDTAEHFRGVKGLHLFHFSGSNCSQKVRIYLEEKGLDWVSHHVDLKKGENCTDDFVQINPKGLVPVLIHDGVTVTESNDIMEYLEEKFPDPPLQPKTGSERESTKKWLKLVADVQRPIKYLTFKFLFGKLGSKNEESLQKLSQKLADRDLFEFYTSQKEGFPQEIILEKIEMTHGALQQLEERLSDNQWIDGDVFSIADIAVVVNVHRYKLMNFPMAKYPHVLEWYKRMRTRRSFQRGILEYEGMLQTTVFPLLNSIDSFLGYGVQAYEWRVQPSWTKPIVALFLLLISYFFLSNGVNFLGLSVSQPIILGLLVVVLYSTFKSAYLKAHTPALHSYQSALKSMKAVVAVDYRGKESMKIDLQHPQPQAVCPDDVIIKVKAASVNPIDLRMRSGYGRVMLGVIRRKSKIPSGGGKEFPMILGRDCSGVIAAVGSGVKKFKVGDEVWAAVHFKQTKGTMAEYVVAKESEVAKKPQNISHVEAASIPYVALTTWSALVNVGKLGPESCQDKRVLIHAGTGGIGTFAIQLVKAWGGHVTTTCATDGVSLVTSLGADEVIDYKTENYETKLAGQSKFDVVYDTLGPSFQQGSLNLLKKGGVMASIMPTIMLYTDQSGLLLGAIRSLTGLARIVLPQRILHGRTFKWAFFNPSGVVLETVTELVEQGKIKPVVEKTFSMADADLAFSHVEEGHSRGKTVVAIDN